MFFLLAIVLVLGNAAFADPSQQPFSESNLLILNTNSIGFDDSGTLQLSPVIGENGLPAAITLGVPMPNPFNPRISIPFFVGRHAHVALQIYDVKGRLIRTLADQPFTVGSYSRQWNGHSDSGANMPAGVYMVRIKLADSLETRKITLVK